MNFSKALILYNRDTGQYPTDKEFDKTTLEPLVSLNYLQSNSFVRHLRDGQIHKYKFDPKPGKKGKKGKDKKPKPLEWHCHPKMVPYDNGVQKIEIKGIGTTITIKYLGQTYDAYSILPLIQ